MKHFYIANPLILLTILIVVGYGCNSTKYLEGDERLLTKNSIDLRAENKDDIPKSLEYNLSTLYKQNKNGRWLWLWSRGKVSEKNNRRMAKGKRPKKWRLKRGEPLAVYDNVKSEETSQSMVYFLNNEGFFDAKVGISEKPKGKKKIKNKYIVEPGPLYTLDSLVLKSTDERVQKLLNLSSGKTSLKKDAPINKSNFQSEFNRILLFLQNAGYANMDDNYFRSSGDSTDHKVKVYLEVLPPRNELVHEVFTIGKVDIFTDFIAGGDNLVALDTLVQGLHFKYPEKEIYLRPGVIARNVFIKTGDLYKVDNIKKTQILLANLNSFKIINIQSKVRADDPSILDYSIYLSPKPKLNFSANLEVTTSNNSGLQVEDSRLVGSAISMNLANFNLAKSGIGMTFGFNAGVDFDINAATTGNELIYGADFGTNLGISFPRYARWIGPYALLNKLSFGSNSKGDKRKIIKNDSWSKLKEKSKTNLNFSVNYSKVFQLYDLTEVGFTFGYSFPLSDRSSLSVNQTGLAFFRPVPKPLFEALAKDEPFLGLSFSKQLISGVFFRSFDYNLQRRTRSVGDVWDYNLKTDLSGAEVFLVNKIRNVVSNNTDTITFFNDVNFAQFVRAETTLSYNRTLASRKSFSIRGWAGIAAPFGYSKNDSISGVPYSQQFTAGGPISMRGWRIRELGPGGYQSAGGANTFFQAGDIKLEIGAEYRFPIFSKYVNGVLFAEAGNIWTIKDKTRPNSSFRFTKTVEDGITLNPFYRQIAISGGIGFRLDFSYFVLRFDLGLKVRTPYKNNGSYWFPDFQGKTVYKGLLFSSWNPNIAIGYPF